MSLEEQIDEIVARCAKYSGWELEWKLETARDGSPKLEISDPADYGRSALIVMAHPVLTDRVREIYGRLWHWAISHEEKATFRLFLDAADGTEKEEPVATQKSVPSTDYLWEEEVYF